MTRIEQREQTRRALLREARRLFATLGYGGVGLDQIASATGVTKGALYHHFTSKADLFGVVLAQVQAEVGDAVAAAAVAEPEADHWDQLRTGCRAFLVASTHPDVRQIMLIDGPAVLGWAQWRALDEAASGRHLEEALISLVAEGTIDQQPVTPLGRLLSGAMNEAALWLAESSRPSDLDDAWAAFDRMLEGLRIP